MIRLNKWIADSGLCSRREADRRIAAGQVRINGQVVTELGTKVDPAKDRVEMDGKPVTAKRRHEYLLFHKPAGIITTRSDERGRKTIYDLLPGKYHDCNPAGRLDRQSSGALILTDDGVFLNRITHPRHHLEKRYRVVVNRDLDETVAERLREGILLRPEEKTARATQVDLDDARTLSLILITGYNRQIRRMLTALGYDVVKLKRTAIGPVSLGSLPPGKARRLRDAELKALRRLSRPTSERP